MYNPVSTYRIQFNKGFTFRDFLSNIEYFSRLGILTIYASPVFAAVPGSNHGYDVVDPHTFNPEIGTSDEFDSVIEQLGIRGMGWIQDIVPNHMAFHMDNPYLMDVLENGSSSRFANFFDIDFDHPDFDGKVFIPFLANSPEEIIENGELKMVVKNKKLGFDYSGSFFPVNKKSLIYILSEETNPDLKELAKRIKKNDLKPHHFNYILNVINEDIAKLKELLSYQHYKLSDWHETDKHLNYRRFFTISSLICLKMENQKVFDRYHSFILSLVEKKKIQGLRLDHIDGLKDPSSYIGKLRVMTGDELYIVAEKILGENEELPTNWPIQGSTGYDFLAQVNNLLTYKKSIPELEEYYTKITGVKKDPGEIIYHNKKEILYQSMQGDWENLYRDFKNDEFVMPGDDPLITGQTIRLAIGEFLLAFPRYKLYSDKFPLSAEDQKLVRHAIKLAGVRMPSLIKPLNMIETVILNPGEADKEAALNFFKRCMQFTGPLMAKGIEDTSMYDYNCFIAHNEVGDRMDSYGTDKVGFHALMEKRQRTLSMSMNATSTHDTKRGEDVRARLNVISEIPKTWIKNVDKWKIINKPFLKIVNNRPVPDANEEYFIYQTLTGVFPFNGVVDKQFVIRINDYMVKALREAKINSNWNESSEVYEKSVCDFIMKILARGSDFLKSFVQFHEITARYGIINSLSQVVLKATCPGIPDFYQGSELWDFSLVDPDNRRPVDYGKNAKILDSLITAAGHNNGKFPKDIFRKKENGHIKMWLSHLLMKERSVNAELFIHGTYLPLKTSGKFADNILAFARIHLNMWYITVVPLYTSLLQQNDNGGVDWGDTCVLLPVLAPDRWTLIFTNDQIKTNGSVLMAGIMNELIPVVMKGAKEISGRKAGVLLHVTSLPGKYGTGDLGKTAYQFVDFLNSAGQTYWQILPLNPVDSGSNYSPYSTTSAFAGNILLIDPEWLSDFNLLSEDILRSEKFSESGKADFKKAEEFRRKLLNEAYSGFKAFQIPYLAEKFKIFCTEEDWLDDYALFLCLKKEFKMKPWYKWPLKLRDRDPKQIKKYQKLFETETEKEKFNQFLFFIQWEALKKYANDKGVRIIGDMSFYISYDSADVWSNPEVFKLSIDKKMKGIGGAPPDYFSKTGQFWNMPVYDWDKIRDNNYSWWIKRIIKNLEWFDLVRFDHFRGFSGFWEIPGGEKTAVKGHWVDVPGNEFFERLKKRIPDLPFIAEDLGDIDNKVYELRDRFAFPGMKVLQFAFNDTLERSIHLPHNFNINSVVYTGTHDNNTTKGWFQNELDNNTRELIMEYTGRKLNIDNIQEEFIRLAYSSVSCMAIIPLQDVLGHDQKGRLNNPSGAGINWRWKLKSIDQVLEKAEYLAELSKRYWRI